MSNWTKVGLCLLALVLLYSLLPPFSQLKDLIRTAVVYHATADHLTILITADANRFQREGHTRL